MLQNLYLNFMVVGTFDTHLSSHSSTYSRNSTVWAWMSNICSPVLSSRSGSPLRPDLGNSTLLDGTTCLLV